MPYKLNPFTSNFDFFESGSTVASDIGYSNTSSGLTATDIQGAIDELSVISYIVELIDALTVDFYAPYDMKINSVTNIKNIPTTALEDDGVAYVFGATILAGSKITVTVDVASVVKLNITRT